MAETPFFTSPAGNCFLRVQQAAFERSPGWFDHRLIHLLDAV
jgi:hypothetical protein